MSTALSPWSGPLSGSRTARLPPTAEQDNGNRWSTGRCWLWCGREAARVVWIEPGTVHRLTTDLFACEACARLLADQIISAQLSADLGSHGLPGYADVGIPDRPVLPPLPQGRHRRR
ncbi:hypothetical protein [Streptomyces sp. HPF1205]|uniref:hypothetical protein n=1 Tax=Streptomyces sp. HPF1205 TaxID=2873262 RepID=UPI001CED2391|nr:hypothetical protein [Streptomyces sp. HPF1205]